MADRADVIAAGLAAWVAGDVDQLAGILDPQVRLLAAKPGPWDCYGRDPVLALLRQRRAAAVPPTEVRVDEIDDHTLLVRRVGPGGDRATVTVITIESGWVTLMRQYPSREAALASR